MQDHPDHLDQIGKQNPGPTPGAMLPPDGMFGYDSSPESNPFPVVTKFIALTHREFHYSARCVLRAEALSAGVKERNLPTIERWRLNGACQVWKTRPKEFRLPVKYGMRDYSAITHLNGDEFHAAADCPWDFS